jgi:hypothetical protein
MKTIRSELLTLAGLCEEKAKRKDPVKDRVEAHKKLAEKLRELADGRYARWLDAYGEWVS